VRTIFAPNPSGTMFSQSVLTAQAPRPNEPLFSIQNRTACERLFAQVRSTG
jgi:hypothetical protein